MSHHQPVHLGQFPNYPIPSVIPPSETARQIGQMRTHFDQLEKNQADMAESIATQLRELNERILQRIAQLTKPVADPDMATRLKNLEERVTVLEQEKNDLKALVKDLMGQHELLEKRLEERFDEINLDAVAKVLPLEERVAVLEIAMAESQKNNTTRSTELQTRRASHHLDFGAWRRENGSTQTESVKDNQKTPTFAEMAAKGLPTVVVGQNGVGGPTTPGPSHNGSSSRQPGFANKQKP